MMNHSEAVEQMATERYLLGEMTADERDAFEEHFFDCVDCALDVRTGAAFVEEAKTQLPGLQNASADAARREPKRRNWFAWLTPSIAAPAFALLLAVIGYQNLATIPGLRSSAREPRVLPWTTIHADTRGAAAVPLMADRQAGAVLLISLPPADGYASFALVLDDPAGQRFWGETVDAPQNGAPVSLVLPGAGLRHGSYTLTITGITPEGARSQLDRRVLDVQFK